MSTTFKRNGTAVIIEMNGNKYSVPASSFIFPNPRNTTDIVFSDEYNTQKEYEGISVNINTVEGITFTDRNDLIEKLGSVVFYESAGTSFALEVSKGNIPGHSKIDKFGENPDVDTGTVPEDIWEFGGTYNYDANGTAPIMYLSSSSNSDAQEINIIGLDIDGVEVSQTLTLQGQTVVNLTTPLWRVYRMSNEGSVDIDGTVYCHIDANPSSGVPIDSAVRAIIDDGNNQTLMCMYTVPKGYVGFLYRGELGGSRAQTSGETQCAYYSRRYGKVFKIKKRVDIANSGTSVYQDERSFPDVIPSLTDIKLRIEDTSANNTGVFGTFDILLVEESQFSDVYLQGIGQPGY